MRLVSYKPFSDPCLTGTCMPVNVKIHKQKLSMHNSIVNRWKVIQRLEIVVWREGGEDKKLILWSVCWVQTRLNCIHHQQVSEPTVAYMYNYSWKAVVCSKATWPVGLQLEQMAQRPFIFTPHFPLCNSTQSQCQIYTIIKLNLDYSAIMTHTEPKKRFKK